MLKNTRAAGENDTKEMSVEALRNELEAAKFAQARNGKRKTEEGKSKEQLIVCSTEEAIRELDDFTYAVSHDLRAPLRAIDGFSLALEEDCGHLLDDEGKNHLARVRKASQKMTRYIEALLDLSRLSRIPMKIEDVPLSVMAEEICCEQKNMHPEREVKFDIQPNVMGRGDKRLLRIALTHLFQNAWKFTAQHITGCIEFGVEEQPGKKVYYIKDDGIGFDMAYVGRLFSAFQHLHSQLEFPGTGTGLVTVQRIIRRHGGKVWANGTVEKGAVFYFTL